MTNPFIIGSQEFQDAMMAVIKGGDSPCLIGPSGCGKTQVVHQVAASLGAELVPCHLITMAPEDLKFPIVDVVNETVTFVPAKQFMQGKQRKLFFWDELTHAGSMIQSLAYKIFEENMLGDYRLPADSIHIAAHNRVADRGVHNRVPHPLRRRWFEFAVEPAINEWSRHAVQIDVEALVIGFLRWRPEFLYQDMTNDSELAPDPRAWVKISNLMKNSPGLSNDTLLKLVSGKVGQGVAGEFISFVGLYQSLPSLDALLLNPDKEPLPDNPSVLYAVAAGLSKKATVQNIGRVMKVLARMPVEFSVLCMKDALLRDRALQSTSEVTKWAIQNQDVVL